MNLCQLQKLMERRFLVSQQQLWRNQKKKPL